MPRILVIVEGPTERAALQQTDVATQFFSQGFSVHPKVVGKPGHKGGVRSFERILPEILALLRQEPQAKVSTLFDFYALPLAHWPGFPHSAALPPAQAVSHIEMEMAAQVSAAMPGLMPGRFIPYIQLYEFEALLFANPAAMATAFGSAALEATFAAIVAASGSCEEINNGPQTAPSKRIAAAFPGYKKGGGLSAHAPLILGQIARENWPQLLTACPRFAHWLDSMP